MVYTVPALQKAQCTLIMHLVVPYHVQAPVGDGHIAENERQARLRVDGRFTVRSASMRKKTNDECEMTQNFLVVNSTARLSYMTLHPSSFPKHS